jgi:hypothetical protein
MTLVASFDFCCSIQYNYKVIHSQPAYLLNLRYRRTIYIDTLTALSYIVRNDFPRVTVPIIIDR